MDFLRRTRYEGLRAMIQLRLLSLGIVCLLFTSCVSNGPIFDLAQASKGVWTKGKIREYPVNPVQGSAYVNEAAYASLSPSSARMEINLSQQKATLFDGNVPVIETPISSGTALHPTKEGNFKILEKAQYKESNLYGRWVSTKTGETIVSGADARDPRPAGTVFKGTPVPLWQRITHDGIGMHVGQLPGYAASHGCIRFPGSVMPLIYEKTLLGTPVHVYSRPGLFPGSGTSIGRASGGGKQATPALEARNRPSTRSLQTTASSDSHSQPGA